MAKGDSLQRRDTQLVDPLSLFRPPPVFPIDIGPEGARGRAFTHPEQGSCSPLVNSRASLSWLAYLKLPAIPLRNPSSHSWARSLPPDSACVKALPLALALLHHLGWGPGARAIRAGSIGRDISWKVECPSHPPQEVGCFPPPNPRKNQRLMVPREASWLPGLGKAV